MPDKKDFFISYNKADRAWAEWIAWQLEEAAFSVVIEAWDFRPGGNFAVKMDRALQEAERLIAVLSPDFLAARFTVPEWTAAFAQDPTGEKGLLVPVRVREYEAKGLLTQLSYIDLIGASDDEARERLLEGVNRDRAKPATAPAFPGASPVAILNRTISEKPNFPGAFPPVWHIPRDLNPHFVGRDELLADIRQTLLAGQAAALTALHGMGGVGKTQLAAEYAYAHRADYNAVWWLNADSETTMANDLAAFARALDLPEKDAREIPVIIAAALHWLGGNAGWLLIYDNAPDSAAVRGYLPQARTGHVIVTSRDPNWRGLAQPLEVKTLDAEAGGQFLLERTGQTDTSAAKAAAEELAKELGGLPLALEQAGAYCEATGKSLADYLRLFRQRWQELLRRGKPDNYPATVATTWEIAFEAAERECPTAVALLNLLAFCAPEELPLSVLREDAEELPDELAAVVADELAFEDAIAALRRYSLLARRDDGVTLHRLVQLVARDRLPESEQRRWAEAALRVVNEAFPEESSDVRTWDICAPLLPHAQTVTGFAERCQLAPESTGRLVNQIGGYFFGRAQYAEAKEAFERALRLDEAATGTDHPNVAIRVNNLGEVLRTLGDFASARQCFERALRLAEAASDNSKVAIYVNNLGGVLYNLGDLAGARQYFERALRLDEAAFGTDHPNVARDVNNLGLVLKDLGDLAGARQHYESALKLFEMHLGSDHPNVAALASNLGVVLQDLGDLAGAQQCLERALRLDQAAFGPDHPKVAIRVNNLGRVLRTIGDLAGARRCYERALSILTARLGADHPYTVGVRENLESLG